MHAVVEECETAFPAFEKISLQLAAEITFLPRPEALNALLINSCQDTSQSSENFIPVCCWITLESNLVRRPFTSSALPRYKDQIQLCLNLLRQTLSIGDHSINVLCWPQAQGWMLHLIEQPVWLLLREVHAFYLCDVSKRSISADDAELSI